MNKEEMKAKILEGQEEYKMKISDFKEKYTQQEFPELFKKLEKYMTDNDHFFDLFKERSFALKIKDLNRLNTNLERSYENKYKEIQEEIKAVEMEKYLKSLGIRYTPPESIPFQGKRNWTYFRKMGYGITDWGGGHGNWIAFKKTKIELKIDNGVESFWVDVTESVKKYYKRTKITRNFINVFASDILEKKVDYDKLVLAEKATKNENDECESDEEKETEVNTLEEKKMKLIQNLKELLPKLSPKYSNELGNLIGQIEKSETTNSSYLSQYRKAREIVLSEKAMRRSKDE